MSHYCAVDPCGTTIPDDREICETHREALERALGDMPALNNELNTALSRQTATAARVGGRSAERPLPYDPAASEAQAVLASTLRAWCHEVHVPVDMVAWLDIDGLATELLCRLPELAAHSGAGEAHDEILAASDQAWKSIDRRPDARYGGPCDECGTDLYGWPGQPTMWCRECGSTYDAGDRLRWMLMRVEDVLGNATVLAGMLQRLGVQIADSTIRNYALKDLIKAQGSDERGRPAYRLGDILDLRRGA